MSRFRVHEEVGTDAAGSSFRAYDRLMRKTLVWRPFSSELTGEARDRLLTNGRPAWRLTHPHVLAVLAVEEDYQLSEYLPGTTLEEELAQRRPWPLPRALRVFGAVSQALDYAHRHGIPHGLLHPRRVWLGRCGQIKVGEFSTAREALLGLVQVPSRVLSEALYFPPEVARGQYVAERGDVYSLGVLLYHMLTGAPPFEGETLAEVLQRQRDDEVRPVEVPEAISRGLMWCLQKQYWRRPQSVREVWKAMKCPEFPSKWRRPLGDPAGAAEPNKAGNRLYKEGDFPSAVDHWERACCLDPFNSLTWNNLGTALDGLGRLDEANRCYGESSRLAPYNYVSSYNQASLAYRRGEHERAFGLHGSVLILKPGFAPSQLAQGSALFQLGQLEEALPHWQAALASNPELVHAPFNLAVGWALLGREAQAQAAWQKARELKPELPGRIPRRIWDGLEPPGD